MRSCVDRIFCFLQLWLFNPLRDLSVSVPSNHPLLSLLHSALSSSSQDNSSTGLALKVSKVFYRILPRCNPCASVAERVGEDEEDEASEKNESISREHQPDQIFFSNSDTDELENALIYSNQVYPNGRSSFGAWKIGFLEVNDGLSR